MTIEKTSKFSVFFLSALAVLFVAACGTPVHPTMQGGLTALKGQNIDRAIHYLGYPDKKREIRGKTIYEWRHRFTASTTVPTSVYEHGEIAGKPFSSTSTRYVPQIVHAGCRVLLITEDDIVVDWEYESEGACSHYADRLRPLVAPPEDQSAE